MNIKMIATVSRLPLCFTFVVLTLVLLSSCSTVRFNERERLAKSDMQFSSEPLKAELESHVYSAREGASGSFSEGGGGGCGCY
jgi:hypothetical protein